MRYALFAMIMLMLSTAALAQEDYFLYQNLDLQLVVSNTVQVQPLKESYSTDYIKAALHYSPLTSYRQTLVDMNTEPTTETKDPIEFTWYDPGNEVSFSTTSKVHTSAAFLPIEKKVDFPIRNLDNNLSPYLGKGPIIDTNEDIEQLAASLAEGKNDMYDVTFSLAQWVEQNIQYNLSTSNVEASKPASWVLENRQGVCDELTNLFIAMCRSLGIPARFVSGIAYTNSGEFKKSWGPHGWAEVYFPEYGWVPFDVTYQELGYVDAGHIELQESLDSKEASVTYEYKGRNIELKTNDLNFVTSVLGVGDPIEKVTSLNLDVYAKDIGFGSYNLITVHVKNLKNYYVEQEVMLAKTNSLTILDGYRKDVLLKPYEEKTIHWIVRVDQNLDPRSYYEFPVKVYTGRNQEVTSQFRVEDGFRFIAYEDLQQYVSNSEISDDGLLLLCTPSKYQVFQNEKDRIDCVLKKNGTEQSKGITVCLDTDCKNYDLQNIKEVNFEFTKSFPDLGLKTLTVTARQGKLSKTNYVIINVVDQPALSIAEINAPEEVSFSDNLTIGFLLKRKSASYPKNISVFLNHSIIGYNWHFDVLQNSQAFQLESKGSMLDLGKNTFILEITFTDDNGNVYTESKPFFITLKDPSLIQKGFVVLNKLGIKIQNIIVDKQARSKFFSDPRTWIVIAGITICLVSIEIVMRIRQRRRLQVPAPALPKHEEKNEGKE